MQDTRYHILVVEDDPAFLASVSLILEDEGYTVSCASEGASALDMMEALEHGRKHVELLITDIQMPDMNGLDLIREMNRRGIHIPTVVISGFGDRSTLKELIHIGCDDFIDKPFEAEELLEVVKQALRKNNPVKNRNQAEAEIEREFLERELASYRGAFETLTKELETAVDVYENLVEIRKDNLPVSISVMNRPLKRLGGDFIDIFSSGRTVDILVADVAGHDLAASYQTIMLKALFNECAREGKDPVSFFKLLNFAVTQQKANQRMLTGIFLRIDLARMSGEMVSAGHPSLIRVAETVDAIVGSGYESPMIGLFVQPEFESFSFFLSPKDRLFLFTDGVINTRSIDGPTGRKSRLKSEGLLELIKKFKSETLEKSVRKAWSEVMAFCHEKPVDDMLLLGIEIP